MALIFKSPPSRKEEINDGKKVAVENYSRKVTMKIYFGTTYYLKIREGLKENLL